MAAGWLTPTSPRCLGPLATTARIGSPRSRRASPGENLTRPSRRSSLRSTAAAPMALKCIVFSSGDRDEVWGGRSTWGRGVSKPAFSYLLFITSSVDGDLGCFCLLAAVTVGEQISAQVSLQFFWTCTRK